MKHTNQLERHHDLLSRLSRMPRKIIMMHDHDAVASAVLHELCHESCFNLHKAAYFIDNPDFDMVRGIAGVTRKEMHVDAEHPWHAPEEFSSTMHNAPFHNQVREFCCASSKRNQTNEEDVVAQIAKELHFEHPEYRIWPMKHDNHGIIVFEQPHKHDWNEDHLINGLSLLGLCPIS